jgi:peptidyl-prolyl cis-trans isomerase D
MEAFRTLIRGWLGKVLLALFLVPFALVGIEGYFAGSGDTSQAATVGDRDITQPQLEQALTAQRQQLLQQTNGDDSRIDDVVLRKQVLDNLIARAVLLNQAKTLGFEMSVNQVGDLIRKEATFQENGVFSDKLFQTYLKNSGMDRNTLIQQVRDQAALKQLAGGLNDSAIAATQEQNRLALMQSEIRTVHVANLPLMNYLSKVNVTDAQIAAHYQKTKAQYQTTAQVDLTYITLDAAKFADQVTVTDADIQTGYQKLVAASNSNAERRARHILIAVDDKTKDADAKTQAEALEARIAKGEDFGTLAKTFSKDAGSAVNGGDLGFAAKGTYVPEFEKSLDTLKAGETSKPIKTQFGYHLIQLLETRQTGAPDLASVRAQLDAEARKAKADVLYSDAVNQINEQAVDGDRLVDLAKAQGLTLQTQKAFTAAGGAGDLANVELRKVAFSDDQIIDHRISSGISVDPTRTMWIQANNYQPTHPQTLAEASTLIKSQLLLEQAKQAAMADGQAMVKAIHAGGVAATVASQYATSFTDIGDVTRTKGLPDPKLLAAVFGLPTTQATQPWQLSAVNLDRNGVAVVAISAVTAGTPDSVPEEQRKQIASMLKQLHGQQDLEDYVEYLKSKAKIKRSEAPKKSAS